MELVEGGAGTTKRNSPVADVLVVDDDPSVRSSMVAVLRSGGFTVLEAGDGQEAVDILANRSVRVIVLDLHMAPRDGVWLLEHLGEGPRVIIVSAFSTYDRATILERFSGIVAHAMQKPVAPPALIDLVRQSVGRAS